MGYYIECSGPFNKSTELVENHGARRVQVPTVEEFDGLPEDKALIFVVHNDTFEVAGLVYSKQEMGYFIRGRNGRPMEALLMDKTLAHKLSGFNR